MLIFPPSSEAVWLGLAASAGLRPGLRPMADAGLARLRRLGAGAP